MYDAEVRATGGRIIAERERLFAGIKCIKRLAPLRAEANFLVVRSAIEPRQVFAELLRRDVLIRDVSSYPMLKEYFRVSVGKPEENDQLLSGLREIFV